jgi:hypothetical protein
MGEEGVTEELSPGTPGRRLLSDISESSPLFLLSTSPDQSPWSTRRKMCRRIWSGIQGCTHTCTHISIHMIHNHTTHTNTNTHTYLHKTQTHTHTHKPMLAIVNFLSIFAYHNITCIILYLIPCVHIYPTRKSLWYMTRLSETPIPSSGWTLLGDKTSHQYFILCHLWILSMTLTRNLRTLCGSLSAPSVIEMDLQHWQKMTDPKSIGTNIKNVKWDFIMLPSFFTAKRGIIMWRQFIDYEVIIEKPTH